MKMTLISKSFIVYNALESLFREIIKDIDIKVISDSKNLKLFNLNHMDFVFIDIGNQVINDFELFNILKEKGNTKIMIMDTNKNMNTFMESIRLGVNAYIVNIENKNEFINIFKRVIMGKKYFDINLSKQTIKYIFDDTLYILTVREKEIIKLLVKGLNNKEIGDELHISEYTARKHISNILRKLNLKNRKEAIIYIKDKLYQKEIYE